MEKLLKDNDMYPALPPPAPGASMPIVGSAAVPEAIAYPKELDDDIFLLDEDEFIKKYGFNEVIDRSLNNINRKFNRIKSKYEKYSKSDNKIYEGIMCS